MPTPSAALAALVAALLATALAACGDDEDGSSAGTTTAAEERPAAITKELDVKPRIPKPSGPPPTELVKEDIVVGKGPAAKPGDRVTVHYVGVTFTYGDQFDASWDKQRPFTFELGKGNVIQGWEQGVPGMKVDGRRMLTIPADMAYGAQGQPPEIPPNEPLVFVIDLRRIG